MLTMMMLKNAWVTCKKYWWVFAAVVGFIIYKFVFRGENSSDLSETLKQIQQKHEEELKAILDADEARRVAYEENNKKLQTRLAEIERQYEESQLQLDTKKRSELEKILKDSQDDPDALAQKLSDATGFKVFIP